jgi:hypothetical protein
LLIGRTQTNGKADYEAVRKFQDGMQAVPLSVYGKPYTPPKGTVDRNRDMSAPPGQIDKMAAAAFFGLFAEAMKENPPHANDYPILDRLARLGIVPGKSFSFADAPKEIQDALNAAAPLALKQIKDAWSKSGTLANGWRTNMTAIGTYGTDYLHGRASPMADMARTLSRTHFTRRPSLTLTASRSAATNDMFCTSPKTRRRQCAPSGR